MPSIIFMGTPEFAVPSLRAFASSHEIRAVYTRPPKRHGRGMKTHPSAVYETAISLGLTVEMPERFDGEAIARLQSLAPDFLIVVAYGLILPPSVLAVPRVVAINGHPSLLPRWRGAAPIERAIAAGDTITGTTAMLMAEGLDRGAILRQKKTAISASDTAETLSHRLADATAEVLVETVERFDQLTPKPQNEGAVSWAEKISTAETEIDFALPAVEIARQIRAFGGWFDAMGDDGVAKRITVLEATVHHNTQPLEAGTVLGRGESGGPLIACGDSTLELTRLKPQGKPAMSGKDFLNGNRLPPIIRPKQSDK